MSSEQGKELAKYEDVYQQEVAALDDDSGTVFDEKPSVVEIVHSSQLFKMPDESTESKLKVIVLGSIKFRSMFEGSGEDSKILCQSLGGKVGKPSDDGKASVYGSYLDVQSPICLECPANVWGTGRNGKGKACKEKRNMLLFEPGWNTALILRVPVTSVDGHDQLYSQAKAKKKPMASFWTEVSLNKQQSGEQVYSTMRFEMGDDVPEETFLSSIAFRERFRKFIDFIDEQPQDFTPKSPVYSEDVPVEPLPDEKDDDDLPF